MTGAEIPVAMAVAPELIGAGVAATGAGALGASASTAATLGTMAAGATPGALAGATGLLGSTVPSAIGPAAGLMSAVLPEAAAAGGSAAAGIAPIAEAAPAVAQGASTGLLAEPMMLPQAAGPMMPEMLTMQNLAPEKFAATAKPNFLGGMDKTKMAMKGAQMMMPQDQQQQAPAQRPPSQQAAPQSQAEIMERLRRQQGNRSNFAGLLGQAIGGY